MDKHTCKQCGKRFNYCAACSFKKIPYKAAGFCSKECSAEFKKPKIEEVIQKDVEVVEPKEDTSTSEVKVAYPYFFVKETEVKEEIETDGTQQSNGEGL